MVLWQRFFQHFGSQPPRQEVCLSLPADETLLASLQALAQRERRSREDVAVELLNQAVRERQSTQTHLGQWQSLSTREQQIAALICLNYTNPQMAALLNLSPETIKTHVHNVLIKFSLRRKIELSRALAGWDFSAWVDLPDRG